MPRHQAVRGPQARDPAEGRRGEDRARGLGADREGHEARRHRGAGPARGASAPVIGVPGRAAGSGEARIGVVVPEAAGQLDHGQLGHEHRPRLGQPLDHRPIVVEDLLPEGLGAPGGRDALRRQQVLEAVRDAVEGPAVLARDQLLVGAVGLREGHIAGHGDHGAELRPEGFQALQVRLGQLDRVHLARSEQKAQVAHGGEQHVVADHLRPPFHSRPARGRASKTVTGSSALPRAGAARSRSPFWRASPSDLRIASRSPASSWAP